MEFSLTEEQKLLQDSVRRFVADVGPADPARDNDDEAPIASGEHWSTAAELGWLALLISEDAGGLGGTAEDAAILMEEFGRGLVALPYLSTGVIATTVIDGSAGFDGAGELLGRIAAGETIVSPAIEEPASRHELTAVDTKVRRSGDTLVVNGVKILAIDGPSADTFLVSARWEDTGELVLVLVPSDADGLRLRPYPTIDDRGAADLHMENATLPASALVAEGNEAEALLLEAIDRGRVMMAAEALGAMEAAMTMAEEYLKTRKQFGQPLTSFQSLTHRLADMYVKVENTRSMLYRALSLLDSDAASRGAAVSATMIAVAQAGEFVGGQAIQLHGGIGMAEETPVGHYYKRLRAIARTFGDERAHMRRYIQLMGVPQEREAS